MGVQAVQTQGKTKQHDSGQPEREILMRKRIEGHTARVVASQNRANPGENPRTDLTDSCHIPG